MELDNRMSTILFRVISAIFSVYIFFKYFDCEKIRKSHIKKTYLSELYPDPNTLEEFKIANKKLMEVRVQVGSEKLIQNKGFKVEFVFTMDGMLGFGTELIRQAIDAKQNGLNKNRIFGSLNPITATEVCNLYRGVYLTADSAGLAAEIDDNLNFSKINNSQDKLKKNPGPILQKTGQQR